MGQLLDQLSEDYRTHGRGWTLPGFHAVAVYRVGRWARNHSGLRAPWVRLIAGMLAMLVRNVYGIELPSRAHVGRRFKISHQSGIVIAPSTRIGDDCRIRQNVTIGGLGSLNRGARAVAPTLGDRVYVASGAVLVGDINIGDDVHIGPNAVVMTDVPDGATVFARPAQVIKGGAHPVGQVGD